MMLWGRDKKEPPKQPERPQMTPAAPRPAASPAPQSGMSAAPPVVAPVQAEAVETPKSLEEVLVETGAITPEQMEQAQTVQREKGGFLVQILIDLGFISNDSYTSFLAKHCRIPYLSLLDLLVDKNFVAIFPREVCLKYRLLPIDKMARNLTVAMVNPLDLEALQTIRTLCPDLRIKPILCALEHFEEVAKTVFEVKGEDHSDELTATSLGLHMPLKPEAAPSIPEPAKEEPERAQLSQSLFGALNEEAAATRPSRVLDEPHTSIVEDIFGETEEMESLEAAPPPAKPVDEGAKRKSALEESVLMDAFQVSEAMAEPADEELSPVATVSPAPAAPAAANLGASMMQEMVSIMRDSMRDTYAMLARRVELFRGISPEDVARLFAKGATVEYEKGSIVFEKGDTSRELYIILGGAVDIVDGERVLATLNRGGMFGEMALVSSEPRSATAIATEITSVLVLSEEIIRRVLTKEAAVQLLLNMLITLSQRLRIANRS